MAKTQSTQKFTEKKLLSSATQETNAHREGNAQSVVDKHENQSHVSISPEGMSWAYPECLGGPELKDETTSRREEEESSQDSGSASEPPAASPSASQDLNAVQSSPSIPSELQSPSRSSLESEHFDACPSPTQNSVNEADQPEQVTSCKSPDRIDCEQQVEIDNFLNPSADFLEQIMDDVPTCVKATMTNENTHQQHEADTHLLALSTTFGMLMDEGMHLLRKTMDNVHSSVLSGNKQMHTDMIHLHHIIHMGWVQLADQMSSLIKVLTTLIHNQQSSSTLLHNVALQRTIAISEGHFPDYLRCETTSKIAKETVPTTRYIPEESLINASSENPAANSSNSEMYK
ncbi:uncharacterized protein LOC125450789 [Stegostoma tigrinum]|uniref:uncharacterized protein LOC125450789 n=1 Tax=Stegostoma tigrinum TaxID=3053191 RepID=UPI00202AD6B1|nr:uncharacterized protein LOC125450789 [Stegostoma tigrinum]